MKEKVKEGERERGREERRDGRLTDRFRVPRIINLD